MQIQSIKYTNAEESQIKVTLLDGSTLFTAYPLSGWQAYILQRWLDKGNSIQEYVEPTKTYAELLALNTALVERWLRQGVGMAGALALIFTIQKAQIQGQTIPHAAQQGALAILGEIEDAVTLAEAGTEKTVINTTVDISNLGSLF